MNFREWFEQKAKILGEAPYLHYRDRVYSYEEMNRMSNRAAGLFTRLGFQKGDICTILMENRPEYLFLWFGLAKIGAVAACLNRHLRGEALAYLLDLSDSRAVVLDAGLKDHYEAVEANLPRVKQVIWYPEAPPGRSKDLSFRELFSSAGEEDPPPVEIKTGDPMALMHTGGTTGYPKWCTISHNFYIQIGRYFADFLGLTAADRLFNPLPLFHMNPQGYYVMGSLAANASIVMVDQFSASLFWKQVHQYGVTCLILHVGIVDILKSRPDQEFIPGHSVRVGYRLDAPFMKRFQVPCSVVGYGSTEAGALVCMNRYRLPLTPEEESLPHLSNVCGKPRDDMELRIGDEEDNELPPGQTGEIFVRPKKPHVIFDGYYKDPQKTAEAFRDLWFHTGDLGFLDAEGKLHFVERKGESLRVRGEWVFIQGVEKVLKSHPGVNDCAVVGIPGKIGGNEIKAVIEPRPGARIEPEEILSFCEGKLAYFMIPRYIEFVPELPKTEAAGRVRKNELKASGLSNAWDREAAGYRLKKG